MRVVRNLGASQGIALPVVLEGFGVAAGVLQRLAQGEVKVHPVIGTEVFALELRAHVRNVGGVEAVGLEVRQAEPHLTQARIELDRPAVGADAVVGSPGGLQRVAVTHPDLRLARVLLEDVLVDADGLLVFADARQHRRMQGAVVGVVCVGGEQPLDLLQRRGVLALAVQRDGVVVPCAEKARRQLQAALEQVLRVAVAANPAGDFGQHAEGRDVRRVFRQVPSQQRLGLRDAVLAQCRPGSQQARVARRGLQQAGAGGLGTAFLADGGQVVGQGPPRLRSLGIELHRLAKRGNRFLAAPECAERQSQFIVQVRPARVRLEHRGEQRQCPGRVATAAAGDSQHEGGMGMVGDHLENLGRLFGGQCGIALEQLHGVRECDLDRPDRFCCSAPTHVTNLPRSFTSGGHVLS